MMEANGIRVPGRWGRAGRSYAICEGVFGVSLGMRTSALRVIGNEVMELELWWFKTKRWSWLVGVRRQVPMQGVPPDNCLIRRFS